MKRRFNATFFIALLCTAATIVAVAAAPMALFAAQDDQLFTQPLSRLRQTSRLSPEGEDLYLVRTLHARNEQLLAEGAAFGYTAQPAQPQELRPALSSTLDAMAKAGVLPASLCSEISFLLEQEGTSFTYSIDGAGFELIQCSFAAGNAWSGFGLEREPRTGRAVNLWLSAPIRDGNEAISFDAAAALQAYKSWLGLDSLDDWTAGNSRFYNAQLISQKALTQLSILYRGSTLSLGMAALGSTPAGAGMADAD